MFVFFCFLFVALTSYVLSLKLSTDKISIYFPRCFFYSKQQNIFPCMWSLGASLPLTVIQCSWLWLLKQEGNERFLSEEVVCLLDWSSGDSSSFPCISQGWCFKQWYPWTSLVTRAKVQLLFPILNERSGEGELWYSSGKLSGRSIICKDSVLGR